MTDPAEAIAELDLSGDVQLPDYSDEAIAELFVGGYRGEDFRYVPAWGRWLWWDGRRWIRDDRLRAYAQIRRICANRARQIIEGESTSLPEAARKKFGAIIASAQKVAAVERLSRADEAIARAPDIWDADPWALCTPDGVVDLRHGDMREHRRQDHIMRITTVSPSPRPPRLWIECLRQWTDGDEELIGFLRRWIGYSLTGVIPEHALVFLHGAGANGKSTFLAALRGLLGDYCTVAAAETFIESRGDRHPADLAALQGARMVLCQEIDEGARWATSRLKSLTAGDPITARYMRMDYFTFTSQVKLTFAANHRPALRTVDEAMRRRIHMVPFTVTIPPHQRDDTLGDRLREEWPQILGWAIEGCHEWQQIGLAPPDRVKLATADYLTEEDVLGIWIAERLIDVPNAFASTKQLHSDYQAWADQAGEKFLGSKRFSQALEDRGFERARAGDGTRGFRGLAVRPAVGTSGDLAMPDGR